MSRFTQTTNEGRIVYAWGFDHECGYFFSKFDEKIDGEEDDNCLFDISSTATLRHRNKNLRRLTYSNAQILEAIEDEEEINPEFTFPQEHKDAISLDIPF